MCDAWHYVCSLLYFFFDDSCGFVSKENKLYNTDQSSRQMWISQWSRVGSCLRWWNYLNPDLIHMWYVCLLTRLGTNTNILNMKQVFVWFELLTWVEKDYVVTHLEERIAADTMLFEYCWSATGGSWSECLHTPDLPDYVCITVSIDTSCWRIKTSFKCKVESDLSFNQLQ